jgi:stearoyl-CoA desaturase (delta-9 desaturase)
METPSFIKNITKMYCVIPVNVAGIYALYQIAAAPAWWWVAAIVGYMCIMMLGVAGCYHRLLSHKGYEVARPVKLILLWFAAIAGQGSPMFWVGIHRRYHHRFTDTLQDPHSPVHGFWHSYILWMYKTDYNNMSVKSIVDLFKDPDCMFFHRHYAKIFFLGHIIVALINFDLWLYAMALPAFVGLHGNGLNTSLNHYSFMGYRNYKIKDNSVNSPWLFPFILGEAWHNNHHGDAKNPNYGHRRWWEIDPTYWLIQIIRSDK